MWNNTDDLEALRIGIQSEIETYKYFKNAMTYFSDGEILSLLAALAREELRHRKRLEDLYRLRSGHRLLYIKLRKKPLRLLPIKYLKSDLEILENVLKHEKESKLYYEKIARLTRNAKGKAMLDALASQEQKHIDFLQTEYNIRKKLKENPITKSEVA
jgi:rubrerythrin